MFKPASPVPVGQVQVSGPVWDISLVEAIVVQAPLETPAALMIPKLARSTHAASSMRLFMLLISAQTVESCELITQRSVGPTVGWTATQ